QQREELEPRQPRHPVVGDDEIDLLSRQNLERFDDVAGADRPMAGALQRVVDQEADGRLVVDVEDCGHCGGWGVDRAWEAIGYSRFAAQLLPPERRYWLSDACIPAAATLRRPPGQPSTGARENGLMRITNGIIQRTALANLQLNMRGMLDSQQTATTGKRIRVAS